MKYVFIPMFTLLCLAGCSSNTSTQISVKRYHDYDEIIDRTILWMELLNQEEDFYYSYVYSPRCGHCNDIKQDVIEFALNHESFYFIEFTSDILITDNPSTTIGETDIEKVAIVGTPTLFEIYNKQIKANIAGSKNILATLTNHNSL